MQLKFINPNLHVILIHYPLGLLAVGLLIELLAPILWRRSAFRAAGRWMILIGALALVPTATIGLYAMADTNRTPATPDDATWAQVRATSPVQGEAWEMMQHHAWYNAAGSAVILLLVVLWLGGSDRFRSGLHLLFLLGLIGGFGALVIGSWHGGEMIYRFGVGVQPIRNSPTTQLAGEAAGGGTSAAAHEQTDAKDRLAYYAPPLQVHVILAGSAIAIALAALGLSLRAGAQATVIVEPTPELSDISSALNPNVRAARPMPTITTGSSAATAGSVAAATMDDAALQTNVIRRPPMGRFWLLAVLLGLITAATGYWTLAQDSSTWDIKSLWHMIADTSEGYRRIAHVVTGVSIVALMLVLAVVSRMRAGRSLLLFVFTLALLAAVLAQIWFGSLLMFDTPGGSLGKFNGGATAMTSESSESGAASTTTATAPAPAPATTGPATTSP